MAAFAQARTNMIDCQLRPNKVTDDRLLDAVNTVPREAFLPDDLRNVAYIDQSISLGNGRYMFEPMVLARLIQALELKSTDFVLDIGAATGYAAALLSRLVTTVVVLEEQAPLAYTAIAQLQKLGCDNTAVITTAMGSGYAKQAPYDAILVEGGVEVISDELLAQLNDGGRLVAVALKKGHLGCAKLWRKQGNVISETVLFDASAHLLPGFEAKKGFSF